MNSGRGDARGLQVTVLRLVHGLVSIYYVYYPYRQKWPREEAEVSY